jgi:FAD/FMN-containing dehydrogenase
MMPRTSQEIMSQADKLAKRFEEHEPDAANVRDAGSLRKVRKAFQRRAATEQELANAVRAARDDGHSWAAIGAMLGTSGEAARQRYGTPAARR